DWSSDVCSSDLDPTLALEPLDHLDLLLRPDLRDHIVEPERARDRLSGRRIVAGDHDQTEPFFAKVSNRFGGGRLDRIRNREKSRGPPVDGREEDGRAAGSESFGALRQLLRLHALLLEQSSVAER